MSGHFDPAVPRQCREDDADDVTDKDKLNFCDYYAPSEDAFDPARKAEADSARAALDSLFGDGDAEAPATDSSAADDLFK